MNNDDNEDSLLINIVFTFLCKIIMRRQDNKKSKKLDKDMMIWIL